MYDFRQVFGIFPTPGATVTLTRRDVEAIAMLARLEISEAELPIYVGSLSRIVGFIDQLSAAATDGVEPMAHPLENQVQALRDDQVTETDHRDRYQGNAPAVEAGLYLVPKVIE
jgi:aspartyl-tRNA(Asn)/glutamyl-tRNA(Gln) amidotransferase subunit C